MINIRIEFDEAKRLKILKERGLELRDDPLHVFADRHVEFEDTRKDYGERRYRVWGFLRGRRVSLVWTPRGDVRRIITMRYAHEEEHQAFFRILD